jgi:hypothetical protein
VIAGDGERACEDAAKDELARGLLCARGGGYVRRILPVVVVVLGWAFACSSLEPHPDIASDPGSGSGASSNGAGTGGSGGSGGLPPEQELEETFREPVVSGRWIWTANPDTGKVALIDAESLNITTGEAELAPTYLAPLASRSADEGAALVINVGTDTASILRGSAGVITGQSVPIHHGANSLEVTPSGGLVVAWTNAQIVESADPTEGFQDVSVITLGDEESGPKSRRLTVGYRPSRVFFDHDEERAFVISEASISVVALAGDGAPKVLRDVPLGANPSEAAASRDVSVTPDGALALVRHEGSSVLDFVDLVSGVKTEVSLPGPVTDLDLSPDATRAYAVVRARAGEEPDGSGGGGGAAGGGEGGVAGESGPGDAAGQGGGSVSASGGEAGGGPSGPPDTSLLVVLALPDIWEDPGALEVLEVGDRVGSIALAETGDVGVLYTNAVESDHLVIVTMSGAPTEWELRTVVTKAPVKAVFPAPDGEHAIAFLGQLAGSSMPGGYSIVPLKDRLPPKIVPTRAPPVGIAIAPSPSRSALVTVTNDTDGHAVHVIRMPALSNDAIDLPSVPLAAGVVAATEKGFVAQRHPEGRITFVELATGSPRTVTGFELADEVDYASN